MNVLVQTSLSVMEMNSARVAHLRQLLVVQTPKAVSLVSVSLDISSTPKASVKVFHNCVQLSILLRARASIRERRGNKGAGSP